MKTLMLIVVLLLSQANADDQGDNNEVEKKAKYDVGTEVEFKLDLEASWWCRASKKEKLVVGTVNQYTASGEYGLDVSCNEAYKRRFFIAEDEIIGLYVPPQEEKKEESN